MNAPDRIFAIYGAKYGWGDGHCTDTLNNGSPTCGMATEYVRADLYSTQAARIAELEAALRGFDPHRIGAGQSTDMGMLHSAWLIARAALSTPHSTMKETE